MPHCRGKSGHRRFKRSRIGTCKCKMKKGVWVYRKREKRRKIRKAVYMCISEKLCENKNAKENPCLETLGKTKNY